jgi:soluble lytic murein transglycosylase-like protein
MIAAAARAAALDPALVHAVIAVESGYGATAKSPKGAVGLMQVMPETALRYGVRASELATPAANLRAGTRYLRDLFELFDSRIELALAAYNAGEHAVLRNNFRIPPYRETQQYVPAVLALYAKWREAQPLSAPPKIQERTQYLSGTQLDAARLQNSVRE